MAYKSTTAFAPASIGNVSLGFDLLGAALQPVDGTQLGDTVKVSTATDDSFTVSGRFANKLPPEPEKNIVLKCLHFFREKLTDLEAIKTPLAIELSKNLPIGSGLGSSASSIVAAFAALNAHFDSPFNKDTLLLMMGECEGQISGSIHYDNVAPSYLGGMTFMTGLDSPVSLSLPLMDSWYWTVCYSGLSVSTSAARDILPREYALQDTLTFGKQLGVFIHGLHTGNAELAASMMHDVIAEPYRQSLLPKFLEARQAAKLKGALAFGISGSGPTVFAVTSSREEASDIAQWLQAHYVQNENGFSHVCRIPDSGIEIHQSN
jgi:homoserine kinase